MNARPSLLERAAEIYDFGSGLPLASPRDLPPPRVRPAPPVGQAPEAPGRSAPVQPARSRAAHVRPAAPARHAQVELDREALAAAGFLVPDAPAGSLAEEMRLIKRRLLASVDARVGTGDERGRIVLVGSGQPGEGKTFTALNLALSIAGEPERRVLLIDGDSAKPELMARLGLPDDGAGFIDSIADPAVDVESCVLDTDIERLSLLAAGRKVRNVPELLASGRTEEVLARLLAADPSRIILIDSSPALASSSAAILAGHAGHALVVVKADQTSEADLKETLDLLSACENLSLVLNNTAFQVRGRRFGKYEEYR